MPRLSPVRAMMTGAVLVPVSVTSHPGQSSVDTILKVLRKTGGFHVVVPGVTFVMRLRRAALQVEASDDSGRVHVTARSRSM